MSVALIKAFDRVTLHPVPDIEPQTIRVFLVEDYRLTRLALIAELSLEATIELVGDAEDAESALPQIEDLKPDVVLMDLGLSGMDGIQAIKLLRSQNPAIKLIACTAHEAQEEMQTALNAGVDAYFVKWNATGLLGKVITTVMDGKKWLDPVTAGHLFQRLNHPLRNPKAHFNNVILSPWEAEILKLISTGQSNAEIARSLFMTVEATANQVGKLLEKLPTTDRLEAALWARREMMA